MSSVLGAAAAHRRAGEQQRASLNDTFARLCAIASPSGAERACADAVTAELRALGVEVEEDDAGAQSAGDAGNLLARLPGTGPEWMLLCAHLDTVPLVAVVEPVLRDDGWENANDGILGADNKAAIAVMLELARAHAAAPGAAGLELLFTVGEETSLAGARAFDVSRLRSRFGYVFDHASPIGEVVTASPTHYGLQARLRGVAAHAGIRPEDGRSAIVAAAHAIATMQLGRIDEETTANIGVISGGEAINVVPDECRLEGEARSLDPVRAEATITAMVDRLADASNRPDCECDLDVGVERRFAGYRTPRSSRALRVAEDALRACGYEPRRIATGGASDANAFVPQGVDCLNLANGTERNHQPDERVSVAALEGMLDVAFALAARAGEAP